MIELVIKNQLEKALSAQPTWNIQILSKLGLLLFLKKLAAKKGTG